MISSRTVLASAWPLGGLHDRADQDAGRLDLAVADLGGDVGVGRDRLVDGRGERAACRRRPPGPRAAMTSVGRALAGDHALEHGPGQLVVELARVDQRLQLGDLLRRRTDLGEVDAALVGAAGQLAQPPLAGAVRRWPRRRPSPRSAPPRRR